jgi:hypothetical protein
LFVIGGLIDHFLHGSPGDPVTPALPVPMEAVDFNLVGDEWVLIVMPDGVLRLDIALLEQRNRNHVPHNNQQAMNPIEIRPNWIPRREVAQISELVGAAG